MRKIVVAIIFCALLAACMCAFTACGAPSYDALPSSDRADYSADALSEELKAFLATEDRTGMVKADEPEDGDGEYLAAEYLAATKLPSTAYYVEGRLPEEGEILIGSAEVYELLEARGAGPYYLDVGGLSEPAEIVGGVSILEKAGTSSNSDMLYLNETSFSTAMENRLAMGSAIGGGGLYGSTSFLLEHIGMLQEGQITLEGLGVTKGEIERIEQLSSNAPTFFGTVGGIVLAPGQNKLEFSFGATPYGANQLVSGEEMTLYADFGNGTAHKLDFTAKKGSRAWYTVSAVFEITGGTPDVINFQITAKKSRSKVDDFKLATTDKQATQTIEYAEKENLPLPEIPETVKENSDYQYVTHFIELNGKTVRNYSYYYSPDDRIAVWVAYPLNTGLIGSGSRTDDWGYDPKVPRDEQPTLFSGYDGDYDRGHQLPSADRLNRAANKATFYFTNMTPQIGRWFNQSIWANFEGTVRNWAEASDTLYVVTGCLLEGSRGKAYDNDGKAVTIPGAYFKALLRYSRSSTMSIGPYSAAGFYFEHKSYGQGTITDEIRMSIDELEAITGMDFFVNLADKVGAAKAAEIEAQDPDDVGFWRN